MTARRRRRPGRRPPLAARASACSAAGGGASRRRARTASRRSAPLVSVLLFLAAIISAFWYLRNEEIERETESVKRDTEIAQQQIAPAPDREPGAAGAPGARARRRATIDADELRRARPRPSRASGPEITHMSLDRRQRARRAASHCGAAVPPRSHRRRRAERRAAARPAATASPSAPSSRARDRAQPVYSRPFRDASGAPVFQLHVPLIERGSFAGALIAEYSVDALLRHCVPAEVAQRHTVAVRRRPAAACWPAP
ncbi:MAG: hypothetical protein MZW92_70430 [Comamonadaceae bacterium]|nr:hypothetical protein [Comamonadaceae bacterium]